MVTHECGYVIAYSYRIGARTPYNECQLTAHYIPLLHTYFKVQFRGPAWYLRLRNVGLLFTDILTLLSDLSVLI